MNVCKKVRTANPAPGAPDLEFEGATTRKALERLRAECLAKLDEFERQFGMSSEEAYQLRLRRLLPDTHEHVAWMGYYRMHQKTDSELWSGNFEFRLEREAEEREAAHIAAGTPSRAEWKKE
jgi:hypothetical protein